MFHIAKQAEGLRGSFVRLIRLDNDDYTVIVRRPGEGRLENKYIGPDPSKAEETFNAEAADILSPK